MKHGFHEPVHQLQTLTFQNLRHDSFKRAGFSTGGKWRTPPTGLKPLTGVLCRLTHHRGHILDRNARHFVLLTVQSPGHRILFLQYISILAAEKDVFTKQASSVIVAAYWQPVQSDRYGATLSYPHPKTVYSIFNNFKTKAWRLTA